MLHDSEAISAFRAACKVEICSATSADYGMKRGLRSPPFKSGLSSVLGPPVIQGSKVPLFSLSILNMIHWNSSTWVLSTMQTSRKQNESNGRFQAISKIKLVCPWECSDNKSSLNKRNGDGPHRTQPLPIPQMELPGIHEH